jgi:hypothetical protein
MSLDVLDFMGAAVAQAANAANPGSAVYRHRDISQRDETEAA